MREHESLRASRETLPEKTECRSGKSCCAMFIDNHPGDAGIVEDAYATAAS